MSRLIRIEPQFVGRVWGWNDLHPWYDRVATSEPIGEVWLSGDQCRIATGPHAGKTLEEIFRRRNAGQRHGNAGGLAAADLDDLLEYVREQ